MAESPILDFNQPQQQVQYCIPLFVRDAQIKRAITCVKGRIQPVQERRDDPIAVVGFGASLRTTWEKIRDFKFVMSCSGSHKFLIERGIIPNFHVEVDPRPHKVGLLGPPHRNVEYLAASSCHPDYFKHLEGFNVKLWHVFDTSPDGLRLLPPGEWAVTGGCDAGLRAMTLAGFLGFRALHVFGLDGCAPGPDEERHADVHPNGKQKYSTCVYREKTYWTTPAMLEAAKQTFHELDHMPTVTAMFYGEGLIQDIAQHYTPNAAALVKPFTNTVGFYKPELISTEYRRLNAQLHEQNPYYGAGGAKHAITVKRLVESMSKEASLPVSVLDYACGKGLLARELEFPIYEYDPAIPGKDESPRPADLVVCSDVLEHVEPDKLLYVLDDLRRCVKQVGFFTINTGPAMKTLPDGRNTHLIQQNRVWWEKKLSKFFTIGKIWEVPSELIVVVGVKQKAQVHPQ